MPHQEAGEQAAFGRAEPGQPCFAYHQSLDVIGQQVMQKARGIGAFDFDQAKLVQHHIGAVLQGLACKRRRTIDTGGHVSRLGG